MDEIRLTGIEAYGEHGCLPQEKRAKGLFRVDVVLRCDLSKSGASDRLEDTVDYVACTELVKEELAIRSKTVEHVAERMAEKILTAFDLVAEVELEVTKVDPPVVHLGDFSVRITRNRA